MQPTKPALGDGPVMRWIAHHAKTLLTDATDRHYFADVLTGYRYARDNQRSYNRDALPLMIDGQEASIDFGQSGVRYTARIIFEGTRLLEKHSGIGPMVQTQLLIATEEKLPESIIDVLNGRDVGQIIILPETLQPITIGRKIVTTENRDGTTFLHLDPHPWI